MKTIIKYRCEICHRDYETVEHAKECEAQGLHEIYPIGLIYGNHTKGSLYQNCTFAIAENRPHKHWLDCSLWACRDNGHGDSLGGSRCGSGNFTHLNDYHAKLDPDAPHFKRMVAWLESQSIPVTVWDGEKPVPLAEWLSGRVEPDDQHS